MTYKICFGCDIVELAGKVEQALESGFSLQGGVSTGVDAEMKPVLYQAVFKEEDE